MQGPCRQGKGSISRRNCGAQLPVAAATGTHAIADIGIAHTAGVLDRTFYKTMRVPTRPSALSNRTCLGNS